MQRMRGGGIMVPEPLGWGFEITTHNKKEASKPLYLTVRTEEMHQPEDSCFEASPLLHYLVTNFLPFSLPP